MVNNTRKPQESKEDYHKRLREEEQAIQNQLAGKLIWNSTEQGTYTKPVDVTPEPIEKPKAAYQVGGDPVYATGGTPGEDEAYASNTDTEPMYFKSKSENK